MMKAKYFNEKLLKSLRNRQDITITQHNLYYENTSHNFLRIISKKLHPTDKIILISAGIHGEEIAGPITLLRYLNLILDYIHAKNLRVIIYPNVNPYGFEEGVRFNPDGNIGGIKSDSNDFMRYIRSDGTVTDDLKEKNIFKEWLWSSDEDLNLILPEETRLLHRLLKKDPLRQVVAAIDLHQDYITKSMPAAAYHYIYGDATIYSQIFRKIEKIAFLLANTYIDAGYSNGGLKSDSNACLVRYDGSLSDLMQRLGVRNVVTVETTGSTPLTKACEVNLAWIMGLTDLISNKIN